MTYTLTYIHLSHDPWSRKDILLFLYAMLKYLWTGIVFTPDFLKRLQRRLAFIDMNRDHSHSGISQWKKKFNLLVSPCVNNVWTLLCEHPSVNCFFKCILPCMFMHKASLSTSTSTCTTLPLAYHHVSPSVNNVWTMCEHASANCFLKHIWPFMSMYNLCLSTYTCTTLPLACHHVWTMCEHYCVNIHLWIASLNAFYPACACTMQVYLHLQLLHCHLHITMYHHMWTICKHYCVNMHLPIVSLNALYPSCPCTMQVYLHIHVLHCHLHFTMCVSICEHFVNTTVWTSICELFL